MTKSFSVYADSVHLKANSAMELVEWQEILKALVESIAQQIMNDGADLIGHIKGIAEFEPSTYIYFSKPDYDTQVQVVTEGNGRYTVAKLTINIICIGSKQ